MTSDVRTATERYLDQWVWAILAGLPAATIESVRQGCYSDAQLSQLIAAAQRSPAARD